MYACTKHGHETVDLLNSWVLGAGGGSGNINSSSPLPSVSHYHIFTACMCARATPPHMLQGRGCRVGVRGHTLNHRRIEIIMNIINNYFLIGMCIFSVDGSISVDSYLLLLILGIKTFAMWTLLGLPGKEKREKAKKQEIQRVHNSNPLQRHSHVLFQ